MPQTNITVQKLLVTFDDVTRPPVLIAEVTGVSADLDAHKPLIWACFDCLGLFLHEIA